MTSSGETESESSPLSLTNLILVSLVAGSGLFLVNTVILVSLCYRRQAGTRLAPRWDRAGDRVESSSTECLSSSQPATPHTPPPPTPPTSCPPSLLQADNTPSQSRSQPSLLPGPGSTGAIPAEAAMSASPPPSPLHRMAPSSPQSPS